MLGLRLSAKGLEADQLFFNDVLYALILHPADDRLRLPLCIWASFLLAQKRVTSRRYSPRSAQVNFSGAPQELLFTLLGLLCARVAAERH